MPRKLFVVFLLGILNGPLASQDREDAYAQELLKDWSSHGLLIKTGVEPDGTQNLVVFAQESFSKPGGYFPLSLVAKSEVRSILRIYTYKTIGCSRTLSIPQFDIAAVLPKTGVQEFEIPPMKKGSHLSGVCGMDIYSFEITFD